MAENRSRTRLWATAPLALLAFALWQTGTTLWRTPAFNGSLLVEAADGGRLPRFLPAMYSYPDYLYKVAYDWQNTPVASGMTGRVEQSRSGEGMFTRLRRLRSFLIEALAAQSVNSAGELHASRSRDLVTDSLRLEPANPAGWILLARADETLGDREAALGAYLTSQRLAPHSSTLAAMRLGFLEGFLEAPEGQAFARSMIDPQLVEADAQVAGLRGYEWLVDNTTIRRFLGEWADEN